MALTPEVILTVISAVFIVAMCIILLNELADKKIIKRFKKPALKLVKEEYHKVIRKI